MRLKTPSLEEKTLSFSSLSMLKRAKGEDIKKRPFYHSKNKVYKF